MRIPFFSKKPVVKMATLSDYYSNQSSVTYRHNYYYAQAYAGANRYLPIDALSYPALYSVLTKITSSIASLPFKVRDSDGYNYKHKPPSVLVKARIDLALQALNSPNEHYPNSYNFMERIASALVMDGNAYIIPTRNQVGVVTKLTLGLPYSVTINNKNKGGYEYVLQIENSSKPITVSPKDITHIKLGQYYYGQEADTNLKGMPPMLVLSSTADIGKLSDDYIKQFFSNSTNGEVFMTVPMDSLNNDQMLQQLKKVEQSRGKGASTIALTEGIDIKFPPVKSAQDKGLMDLRDQQVRFMASAFGVPSELCGVGTINNIETTNRMFYRYCLLRYITAIEQAFSAYLPEGYNFVFDTTQLLRGDTETMLKIIHSGLGASQAQPYMTRNRALELLGEDKRPEPEFDKVMPAVVVQAGNNLTQDDE